MVQTDLTDLVQRARGGDPRAQEELISDIQNRVYYHCKKMMKNESDAQDAAQDVLVTVLTSLDKLREPAAFYGWVNGITANRCRHLLTQGVREWQMPEDEDGGSMLDDLEELDQQAIPDAVLDDRETQRLLMEIVDALPPEQRMSVLFYYYDEMSVKEIAQAMEVSEGTVKSRLNYARKYIKAGVEDLEKRGTKLYGLAPLPLLLFLLRQEAAGFALGAEQGAQLAAAVLSEAEAAGAAAGAAGTSGAAGGAGGTAAKAGLSIGAKIGIGIAAVALAVGLIAEGSARLGGSEEPSMPVQEPTVYIEPTPEAQEETPEPEAEGPSEELLALLDSIVYYGDKKKCRLTPEQAAAFAAVIRQEKDRVDTQARQYDQPYNYITTSYCAALFDVGDGTPALFYGGGMIVDRDWKPYVPEEGKYKWDTFGVCGIWEFRDGQAVRYAPEGMELAGFLLGQVTLREGSLYIGGEDGAAYAAGVYPLTGGTIPIVPIAYFSAGAGAEELSAWQERWDNQPVLCGHFPDGEAGGWLEGMGYALEAAEALEQYAAGPGAAPAE